MLHLDIGAAVEQATQRGEGRFHDTHAGLPGVTVGEFRTGGITDANLGVPDRLLIDRLGLGEGEVTGIAVGALPVDRQVTRGEADGLHERLERTHRDNLLSSVDLIDDRADFECLGQGWVFGRDTEYHQLVSDGCAVLCEQVAGSRNEDEPVALSLAVGDDAHWIDGGGRLGCHDYLGGNAVSLFNQEGARLSSSFA